MKKGKYQEWDKLLKKIWHRRYKRNKKNNWKMKNEQNFGKKEK